MHSVNYQGYVIEAAPYQLADSGRFDVNIHIWKDHGDHIGEKTFSAGNTFETEEEAIQACIEFGRRIIGGEIEGCSVADV